MRLYHVLMLHEHSTETSAWTDIDKDSTAEEMEVAVGQFIMYALRAFRDECIEAKVQPQIELHALVLEPEAYDKLDKATWVNEMEGLVDDVERGVDG